MHKAMSTDNTYLKDYECPVKIGVTSKDAFIQTQYITL
jgi:hypothetical protein